MAGTLNIDMVCGEFLDLQVIMQELKNNVTGLLLEKISCIENWKWENEREIQDIPAIKNLLAEGKIIVLNLSSSAVRNLGIYIEKIKDKYVYDLWISTEGFPDLDADTMNERNEKYFQKIYQGIANILKGSDIVFIMLAIGIETVFTYKGNIIDTIQDSHNVIAWIVDERAGKSIVLSGYSKKRCVDQRRLCLKNL